MAVVCVARVPDPEDGGLLHAPFGAGVYQLRNRKTGGMVLFGESKNVATRMSTLLPPPLGAGGGQRSNEKKKQYVQRYRSNIDYRTKACADKSSAVAEERTFSKKDYMFRT